MTVLGLTHLQSPAFAIEFRHPFGRHLARQIRQNVESGGPVPSRLFQLNPQPTKHMGVALGIHHPDPLLGDLTRRRATTRTQRPENLEGQALMFPRHKECPARVDLAEKLPGAKVAILNPQGNLCGAACFSWQG